MVIIAKKYFFRIILLCLMGYIAFHWFVTFPKSEPKKAANIYAFIKQDGQNHWLGFKEAIQIFQRSLVKDINSESRVRRGAMNKLSTSLELYKADNEKYPATIDSASVWYKDHNKIITDPSFKYIVTPDGLHFKISILLVNGETYSIER